MASIAENVESLGGIAQKRQLVRRGARDRDLTAAVRDSSVTRVRNGWYSTLPESDPRLRAVRVGGRLSGISLIQHLGGWVLSDNHPLHVSLAQNAARMRTQQNRHRRLDVRNPRGVVLHWENRELGERGTSTTVALVDALVRVVLDEDVETAVAALDWALHFGHLDAIDLERIILNLPPSLHWIVNWADGACESLPESLSRTRLRLGGHAVRSQVRLGVAERIDLVVDECVAIEVDGKRFHWDRFDEDRAKDLRITRNHLHSLRPSARMVFTEWPDVLVAIRTALGDRGIPPPNPVGNSGLAGRHRRASRPTPRLRI